MGSKKNRMIVITGPTASGKSALAVRAALRLGTGIISADSRQMYQGIPIVTAVPTPEERAAVPHYLVEFLPLEAYYSAALFEEDALKITGDLMKKNGTAVVCGGSMMYVDALCNGIDNLPTIPEKIRSALTNEWQEKGDEWLREELRILDPEYHAEVDLKNMKRVFHAVEIIRTAGKPFSTLRTGRKAERPFTIEKVAIDYSREELFDRINQRVMNMVEAGLEEEARRVYSRRHLNSLNTVGLKEMFALFDGKMTREEAIARIQKNTRVYAKKQLTWLKRDATVRWLRPEETADWLQDLVVRSAGQKL